MKQLHLHITFLLTMLMSMMGIEATAQDIAVANSDGMTIYYTWANNNTELSVSYLGGTYYSYSNEYTGSVVIPETVTYNGSIYSVTSIGTSAFHGCTGLTSITIPNSVTSIGDRAFSGCSGLTSITIPNSVTSIGNYAFDGCSGLTSVNIPNSVTNIGSSAFYRCSGLTSITIPNSVTSIGSSAFNDCSGLTSITIPNSVTSIGGRAFFGCYSLTSVTINQTDPIAIGASCFSGCANATLYVPIGSKTAYEAADGWKDFGKIEEFFTGTLSDEQGIRYTANSDHTCYVSGHEDSHNASIIIPAVFKGRTVTSIGDNAFEGCESLTTVMIPSTVTNIGGRAFFGCNGLTDVIVSLGNPAKITEDVFTNRGNITLHVPKDYIDAYQSADFWKDFNLMELFTGTVTDEQGVKYTANGNGTCYVSGHEVSYTASIVIPKVFQGNFVTSIGDGAFESCSVLTSITIPNSVTSIGRYAFDGCSGLTSVNIPNSVTSIGGLAFYGCSGLTSVNIPNSVTSIGIRAFSGCSGLTSITIPNSVTSIGNYAFYGCSGLTSVNIPNSVTSIGNSAFQGCSGLTSITIPNSVTSIEYGAFSGCSGLASINIPNSVTSIGNNAFGSCSGLTTITVDTGNAVYDSRNNCNAIIKTASNELIAGCKNTVIPNSVTSIGGSAFYGCSSLTSINIPSSVTSIGNYAFSGCSGLTSITVETGNAVYDSRNNCNAIINTTSNELIAGCKNTVIPNSVTSIEGSAFAGCSGLTSINIPNSVTSIRDYAFYGCSGLTSITVETGNAVYDSRNNCNAIINTASNELVVGCKNTVIPNSVTSIREWAFSGCSGLTSINIPNSVTNIGINAFRECSGLTSINIPNSVTNIGSSAFYRCSGLTSINIPNSVTSIGWGTFWDCSGLTSIFVGWDDNSIPAVDDLYVDYTKVKLYVPKGTKAAYQAVSPWSGFGTIIEYEKQLDDLAVTDVSAIDNVISMEPFEATKGRETTVSLKMKNTAAIRGFQFDMQLPLGVTVVKNENNRLDCSLNSQRLPENSAHTLTVSELEDGSLRFLCGSQYDETFTGTEGDILTVRLYVDEDMLDGLYKIVLKDVKLSETNIDNYYLTDSLLSTMTVINYTPGDISGDGEIDVSDYIGVANYIMGDTPTGFVAAAADVNKDQKVDVSDYIGIANMILYNNIYGQTVSASRSMERRRVNTDVSTLDNVIYISPFEAASNGETQVSIRMKNTVGIRGFQFDLYLPDGMTAVKDGNNRYVSTLSSGRKPAGDQHTLTLSEQPDGAIRFLCGSQYDETFTGTDGEIATLTISIDAGVEAEDYPIYLRSMKLTETDISKFYTTDEIETSVTVTGPSDGRVILRETATSLPVVDETEEVDVVVYRTLKAGEWSTICLPFDMDEDQMKEFFGDEVQLAKYSNYSATKTGLDVTGISISFTAVDLADDGFEANVPYIIKPSKTEDITSFELTTMVAPDDVKAGSNKKGWFYGTYEAETVVPENSLFLNGNKFYYSTGKTKMKAFRAYFTLPVVLADVSNASSRIALSFEEATDVKELKSSRIEGLKSYYNLKGQRVEAPVKKGLYIQNGKKKVVK